MDKSLFEEATTLMFMAFSPIKPTDKLSVFFHFFQNEKPSLIAKTAEYCAKTCSRFPSVAEFSEKMNHCKALLKNEDSQIQHYCNICDQIGLVSLLNTKDDTYYAYRCSCSLGTKYAHFRPYLEALKEKEAYILYRTNDISIHQKKLELAVKFLERLKIHLPQRIKNRILGNDIPF